MTASEPSPSGSSSPPASPDPEGARSIAERALDLLVYLPAGALFTALEDAPETVAKGRARVDQELRNAKAVGRVVVKIGWRQVKGQLESFAGGHRVSSGAAPGGGTEQRPAGRAVAGRAAPGPRERHREPGREPAVARPRPTTLPRDPEVDRAIPDYDILAASQVVRRLDGLGHDELRAVIRHERATRGRRTILHRAEQLLGTATHDRPVHDVAGSDGSGRSGTSGTPGTTGSNSTA